MRNVRTTDNEKGYSAIETVLIIILISILAAIVIPRFSVGAKTARIQACEMNRSVINTMVETYYLQQATWPLDSLADIKTNNNYFPDGIPTCPVDQTSYRLATSPKHRVIGHREGADTHEL